MWAGGKTKLIKHYLPYMPEKVDTYYEPFFGGGAVFLYVMKKYNPRKIIINDINASIMNIYQEIKDNPKEFIDIVDMLQAEYIPKTKENRKAYYFDIRKQHAFDYMSWTDTKEAAYLYFLMKTGFNGIFQINKNTDGRFGTPSGLLNEKEKIYDKDNVLAWNKLLANTEIYADDWRKIHAQDSYNTLVFFDPPYRGSFTSYGQVFTDKDQKELLDYAKSFVCSNVLLSNREMNDGFFDNTLPLHKIEIPVTYTAGRRKQTSEGYKAKKATEILFYTKRNQ